MNNKRQQDIRRILDALLSQKLDDRTADRIRRWFSEPDHREQKDEVLQEFFLELVKESDPDAEAIRKYAELARLLSLSNGEAKPLHIPRVSFLPRKIKRSSLARYAAASVLILLLAGAIMYRFGADTGIGKDPVEVLIAYSFISASSEELKDVVLPDGSKVWLNESTELRYTDNFRENRQLHLTGEAFFQVTPDAEHPFTVETGALSVTVLGTEFNLAAYPGTEQTVVSLASGKVEVVAPEHTVTLAPMEQLVYANESGTATVGEFPAGLIDRWQNKPLSLQGATLTESLERVASFFGVELQNAALLPYRTGIHIEITRSDDLTDVLESLRYLTDNSFNYELQDNNLTICGQ